MTPTKLLIGQIFVVFAIVIAGVRASTRWAAAMLGYQAQLGPPWFELLGMSVYRPPADICMVVSFRGLCAGGIRQGRRAGGG